MSLARMLLMGDDGAGAPKVLTFVDTYTSWAGTNPYTATVALGSAGAKVVHGLVAFRRSTAATTLVSGSVDGNAITIHDQVNEGTNNYGLAAFSVALSAGGSVTASLTFADGGVDRIRLAMWTATGSSTTPHDVDKLASTSSPLALSLGSLNGGYGMAAIISNANAPTITWSNATKVGTDVTGSGSFSAAHDTATTGAGFNPSCAISSNPRLIVAMTF